jgi:hypothetical protein
MAQTKERQASTLTLAAKDRRAASLILRELTANDSGNLPGSLPAGLTERLPERLPEGMPAPPKGTAASNLGQPLSIRQVANLIGCSPWTVRQKLLRRGLPHFRSGTSGRLIFYEVQVVRWIEKQTGGKPK